MLDDHRQPEGGSIVAFSLGREPIAPLTVPGLRFVRFSAGFAGRLAEAMAVHEQFIHERRALGNRASLALLDSDEIAAYGWVSYDAIRIHELEITIPIPRGHAYIWDCTTMEPFRGRGIFPGLLRFMLEDLRLQGQVQAWAAVEPGNVASLRAFERAGFRLVARTEADMRRFEAVPTELATPGEAHVMHNFRATQ
jgi:ribosomal protein S18 acetylase RimI-like enzyme